MYRTGVRAISRNNKKIKIANMNLPDKVRAKSQK